MRRTHRGGASCRVLTSEGGSAIRREIVSGAIWIGNGQIARVLLSMGTIAILARFLTPEDFGVIAIVVMIALAANTIGDFGLGPAVIQRPEVDDRLLSCVFWLNLIISSALAGAVALSAEWFAALFREPDLVRPLQVSAAIFPLTSIRSVHKAILEKALAFRKVALAEVFGTAFGSAVAVGFVLAGAGIWALVAQQIALAGGATLGFFVAARWRPLWTLPLAENRRLLGFGARLTLHMLINLLARHADRPIISRALGAEALGFYTLATQIINYPIRNLALVIQRIMFPVLSKLQADDARLRHVHLSTLHAIALIILPLMTAVMTLSDQLVALFLGSGWAPVADLLIYIAPVGAITALNGLAYTVFLAKDRTGLQLWVGILVSAVLVLAFLIGARFGLEGVAAAYLIASLVSTPPIWWLSFRLIAQPAGLVLRALAPAAAGCVAMAGVVLGLGRGVELGAFGELLVFGAAGGAAFAGVVLLFDRRRVGFFLATLLHGGVAAREAP